MNSSFTTHSTSPSLLTLLIASAIAIAAFGAVRYASISTMQIQTRREIQKTQDQTTAILQDDIPSLHAKIEPLLETYKLRETLIAHKSSLNAKNPHRHETIELRSPSQ